MIGYGLLWLESLTVALLFQATVMAVAVRWGRWLRRVVPVLVAVCLIAAAATLTVAIWTAYREAFRFENDPAYNIGGLNKPIEGAVPASMVIQMFAWTIALVFGTGWILWRGLRRGGETASNLAASWPRGRLAIGLVVALALLGITFSNMDQAVKVQLSSVRADAGVIALAHAPPRPPDRENAALVYRRAFEILFPSGPKYDAALEEKTGSWWRKTGSLDVKDKDLLDYLRQREPGFVLLRQAAAMPTCSFDYNYADTSDFWLPEVTYLWKAAHDLAVDARVKAANGDTHAALEDVAALYGIAGHLDAPVLVTLMSSVAFEKLAARVLEEVLLESTPDAQDLAPLRLEPYTPYKQRLHRAFQFQEAFGLSAFARLGNDDAQWLIGLKFYDESPWLLENVPKYLPMPLYRVFFLPDDLASYRRTMRTYQNMTDPYIEPSPQWWEQERNVLTARSGMVTRALIPAVNSLRKMALGGDATRRLAHVALALTAYRAKKGTYPQNLDALVPDYLSQAPRDPFDGKPLRFKADDNGAVVYSVGPNLIDDGGKPQGADERARDLAFRLKP